MGDVSYSALSDRTHKKQVGMRKNGALLFMVSGVLLTIVTATLAFAAYSAHKNDQDINNFLTVYPFTTPTKLNDCCLCHKGGNITRNGKTSYYGSCDYCHQIYGIQAPHGDITFTLNPYGMDYRSAGRDQAAILNIEQKDSDGDGYNNITEIKALTFPGDPKDYPGLIAAPAVLMNQERLLRLPCYSEFLLMNASKDTDWYATYRGVKLIDLLKHVGASAQATGITVFAPDGYSKFFPIKDPTRYDVMGPYPYGIYYGGLGFVSYTFLPAHLLKGNVIPDKLYMLLAYLRDGDPLATGKIYPKKLSIEGEGPYRLIPPQRVAGSPDRSVNGPYLNDGWDYDPKKDHNAGPSVRSVAAIRVEPLPRGTTDFQWAEGGWNLVNSARLVIYGNINPTVYPVGGMVLDSTGKPIPDVTVTFGMQSLGQVGAAKSKSSGDFLINLPSGEYTLIPSKDGCSFTPGSISINFWKPDRKGIVFTGSCSQ